jgi:hypothetical protein
MMNFVASTHNVTDITPLMVRFEMIVLTLVLPLLKKLKGYQRDRAMPEYMSSERILSNIPML